MGVNNGKRNNALSWYTQLNQSKKKCVIQTDLVVYVYL